MERRELLSFDGVAAIAGAFGSALAQEPGAAKRVSRIHAGAVGNSHIQELPIATKAGKIRRTDTAPTTGLMYADYNASSLEDWHRTPGRQFSKRKGHSTRIPTSVANIFIRVPDGFDVVKWSCGEA
jgi:hypothetical protein